MKRIIAALTIISLLVTACSAKSGVQQGAFGVGRKLINDSESW